VTLSGSPHDFDAFVRGYAAGDIDDGAMTQWLREVFAHGLADEETFSLTMALAHSGKVIEWPEIHEPVADKHSTGGVGDAVTLIAVPLAAACGVHVAKLSGRALGHTGGTIDKLECVPGLRTDLTIEEFKDQVRRVGCAVSAATADIAPAEKKLYALRHRTNTIASVPLIAASIMSKKIAAGATCIVLDVKFGEGAFMRTLDEAKSLAAAMESIGVRAGLSMKTLLTSMDEPLADSIGDGLELDEALTLMEDRGGSKPLREVAVAVAEAMVEAAGRPRAEVESALSSGRAREAFAAMIQAQGGRLAEFDRHWPAAHSMPAQRDGAVARIDARMLGEIVAAAKERSGGTAAQRLGVRIVRRVGDRVRRGEPLLLSWLPHDDAMHSALARTYTIADRAEPLPPRVMEGGARPGPER
jgi:pyrimidine-nucleoside phosphorylase